MTELYVLMVQVNPTVTPGLDVEEIAVLYGMQLRAMQGRHAVTLEDLAGKTGVRHIDLLRPLRRLVAAGLVIAVKPLT